MKRISFLLALLVLSFGLANAQEINLTSVSPYYDSGTETIATGVPITFTFEWNNTSTYGITGFTCGFKFWSTGGTRSAVDGDSAYYVAEVLSCANQNGGQFYNPFGLNGTGTDTLGLGAFKLSGGGLPIGGVCELGHFTVTLNDDADGEQFCIDSCWYPPSNDFLWTCDTGGVFVLWQGPFCFNLYDVPNEPPDFVTCPTTVSGSHCDILSTTVVAEDTDGIGGPPVTYNLLAGPGNLSGGAWSFQPTCAHVGASLEVTIDACDAAIVCTDGSTTYPHCVFSVVVTDQPLAFTEGCGASVQVGQGNSISIQFTAVDPDACDVVHYYVDPVAVPMPAGDFNIHPDNGLFTFNTDAFDGQVTPYVFTVCAYSCTDTVCCTAEVTVLTNDPFAVVIEKTHNTFQGMHEYVDVDVTKGSELFGGFDILIAYDASALTFQSAAEGELYGPPCNWEYFTYRFGPNGNCGNACPSGMLRVVGIAEMNNGPVHPDCFGADGLTYPITLFELDFLVTNDRTFECMYVPIRFFWMDCGDNTLASKFGDTLFISRYVWDFELIGEITDPYYGYPTYTGAQDEDCFVGDPNKVPIRFIDFYNGGIDIVCADSIDARGDINLNEIPNEIADAVLFSNYFVYGLSVFKTNMQGQIAASDVNADGLTLSVADLVYQVRVIVGDALAYDKLSPVAAEYGVSGGVVSIDGQMGGAYLVVAGNATPELLANNMELKYNFDGENTNVLVWSQTGEAFEGSFLNAGGEVLSAEFATADGAPVVSSKTQPETFALMQNYPNPFNPTTTIKFTVEGQWTLNVYNVAGQVVETFAGNGPNEVVWNASGLSSGIYFYKLEAEGFSATKKMVLLK